jgi:hypothetical protein
LFWMRSVRIYIGVLIIALKYGQITRVKVASFLSYTCNYCNGIIYTTLTQVPFDNALMRFLVHDNPTLPPDSVSPNWGCWWWSLSTPLDKCRIMQVTFSFEFLKFITPYHLSQHEGHSHSVTSLLLCDGHVSCTGVEVASFCLDVH